MRTSALRFVLVTSLAACTTPAEPEPAAPTADAAPQAAPAAAEVALTAQVGKPAPDFELTTLDNQKVNLASLRGKTVVLEWFNPECPFVVYAHGEGPLKDMAQTWQARGLAFPEGKGEVVWLAINSGAPGKQGYDREKNKAAMDTWGMQYQLLLDPTGEVGKRYGAKTTPHMYVINPEGTLVYAGALDNAPFGTVKGSTLHKYTEGALTAVEGKRPADPAETVPYGCAVKYSM